MDGAIVAKAGAAAWIETGHEPPCLRKMQLLLSLWLLLRRLVVAVCLEVVFAADISVCQHTGLLVIVLLQLLALLATL